jgi:hypothetical protein
VGTRREARARGFWALTNSGKRKVGVGGGGGVGVARAARAFFSCRLSQRVDDHTQPHANHTHRRGPSVSSLEIQLSDFPLAALERHTRTRTLEAW